MPNNRPVFAIIGAGSIGLATAADLGRRGYSDVRLCDSNATRITPIAASRTIYYDGLWGRGTATVSLASSDHATVVEGADIILVSTTADAHAQVAKDLAPHLRDGQNIVLHQGYVAGALHFRQQLAQAGCTARVTVAESMNTLYLCAWQAPGQVFVKGVKAWVEVTAYPAEETDALFAALDGAFSQFTPGRNSLETGLNNPNPIVHPAAYLFNQGLLAIADQPMGQGALYFDELMTAPIAEIAHQVDQERLALMDALGLKGISRGEFSIRCYPEGALLRKDIPRFGPKLLPRFVYEDIPTGLVPMASLATLATVAMPVTRLLIDVASLLTHIDFWESGRTLERLGLAQLSVAEVVQSFGDIKVTQKFIQ